MAKLAILLALVQSTLIHGLPAREPQHDAHVIEGRAITLSSDLDITTSYSLVVSTLQSVSITETPSITGVSFLLIFCESNVANHSTGHTDRSTKSRFHTKSH